MAKDLLKEIEIMKILEHENIIKVMGLSLNKDFCIIMELCKTNLY